MFELNREVQAWCEAVYANAAKREEKIAELADHLHCEVARLQESGLDASAAFERATSELGDPKQLAREHAKNRNPLARTACRMSAFEERYFVGRLRGLSSRMISALLLGTSLSFAAAILLSSILIDDSDRAATVMFVLMGLWWIPFSVLLAVAEPRRRCQRSIDHEASA